MRGGGGLDDLRCPRNPADHTEEKARITRMARMKEFHSGKTSVPSVKSLVNFFLIRVIRVFPEVSVCGAPRVRARYSRGSSFS